MTYQLYCGDCLDILPTLEAGSVDLTVTSPPYDNLRAYNGYTFDFDAIAKELYRVTKTGGVVVWVVGDETKDGSESLTSFKQAIYFRELGFNLHDTMIYDKGKCVWPDPTRYGSSFEYMFIFSKGNPETVNKLKDRKNIWGGVGSFGTPTERMKDGSLKRRNRVVTGEYGYRVNIWQYASGFGNEEVTDHPAPFPEKLAADHIVSWSNPGDTILDPMMGSGTTGKMSVKLQRNFIGIEISEAYHAIAERRIQQADMQPALMEIP